MATPIWWVILIAGLLDDARGGACLQRAAVGIRREGEQVSDRVTILVIDDHEVIAEGCRHRFAEAELPWQVRWATSLRGVDLAGIDLVVLDLRLADGSTPSQNVIALSSAGVPTVVYTSADDPYLVRESIGAGVLAVVRKSAPITDLIEAIEAARCGQPSASPDWAAALDADGDFVADCLTESEAQVLALYAMGSKSVTVARELGLSKNTVDTYVARIRAKYQAAGRRADSRVDLFLRAAEDGLVSRYSS